jgi:hypothetical protein
VICKSVSTGNGTRSKAVEKCVTKLTSSPITFTTTGTRDTVVLSRNRVLYATGVAICSGKETQLLLSPRQRIGKGSYTLMLTHARKQQHETIIIA